MLHFPKLEEQTHHLRIQAYDYLDQFVYIPLKHSSAHYWTAKGQIGRILSFLIHAYEWIFTVYAIIALRRVYDAYDVSLPIFKVQDSFCEQLLLHFATNPDSLHIKESDKQQGKMKMYVPCNIARESSCVVNEKGTHIENKIEQFFF